MRRAAPGAALVVMSGFLNEPLEMRLPVLAKPFTYAALVSRVELSLRQSVLARLQLRHACGELRQSIQASRERRGGK
jgi:hypothetical protein